jgi:hypothetical protein
MARIRTQAVRRVEQQRKGLHPHMAGDARLDPAPEPVPNPAPQERKSAPRAGRSGGTGARAERPSEGGSEYNEESRRSEPARTKAPSPSS